jgi:hypothetical protein
MEIKKNQGSGKKMAAMLGVSYPCVHLLAESCSCVPLITWWCWFQITEDVVKEEAEKQQEVTVKRLDASSQYGEVMVSDRITLTLSFSSAHCVITHIFRITSFTRLPPRSVWPDKAFTVERSQ